MLKILRKQAAIRPVTRHFSRGFEDPSERTFEEHCEGRVWEGGGGVPPPSILHLEREKAVSDAYFGQRLQEL